ncbi:RlpA-like double-psi beta-barrel-protein domain-containing protein-containing protein [Cerioporus squamosus]|nr:RlpA-like double-psi beta-barrel-protein domain-containing protein-containing protein [Cerioporus squamosus]
MYTQHFAGVAIAFALTMAGLMANVRAIEGSATFFTPGLGACGVHSGENDMVVAVSTQIYEHGRHCKERMRVTNKENNKSVEVTVLDECVGCNSTHIDLGTAAFEKLADVDLGLIAVTWEFVSSSGSEKP